jgi:uncharacterized membrane protein
VLEIVLVVIVVVIVAVAVLGIMGCCQDIGGCLLYLIIPRVALKVTTDLVWRD